MHWIIVVKWLLIIPPILLDDDYDTSMAKIEAFQNLIDCLPLVHQYLLMYIMDMLGLFANAEEKTRMSISSLAAVFAPVNSTRTYHDSFLLFFTNIGYHDRESFHIQMTSTDLVVTRNHKMYLNS